MSYTPPTIEEIGLENYLNETRTKHSDFGYDVFVTMVKQGVNAANLARAFNVDPRTVLKWLEIYSNQKDNSVRT